MPTRELPSGKWQARRWDKDRATYVSLGTYATEADAEKALTRADIIEELGGQLAPVSKRRTPASRGREKFALYAERKLEARKHNLKRSTWFAYTQSMQKWLMPTFGDVAIADIDIEMVEMWWASMSGKPHPRRRAYALLNQTMRKALKERIITENPCQIEGSTKDPSAKRPTFSVGDFRMLHDLAKDDQMRALLWLLVGTGSRIGELLALRWEDIDLNEGTIDIHRHRSNYGETEGTKNHDDGRRVLSMPQEALSAVLKLWETRDASLSDYVIVNRYGKPWGYNGVLWSFDQLRKSCGLDKLRMHDFRHVHLSLYAQHSTLAETMQRAGHSDYRSSMRYQHVDASRQKAIVEQLVF